MDAHYFAYGSNLTQARMRARVPDAEALATGWLDGHRLVWDKPGRDGSGKANVRAEAPGRVWGVVYRFDAAAWADLDAHEPGYERLAVRVQCGGECIEAQVYRSNLSTSELPFDWYHRLVVDGAREHGLPDSWVRELLAAATQPDRTRR